MENIKQDILNDVYNEWIVTGNWMTISSMVRKHRGHMDKIDELAEPLNGILKKNQIFYQIDLHKLLEVPEFGKLLPFFESILRAFYEHWESTDSNIALISKIRTKLDLSFQLPPNVFLRGIEILKALNFIFEKTRGPNGETETVEVNFEFIARQKVSLKKYLEQFSPAASIAHPDPNWTTICDIGAGGQGRVSVVIASKCYEDLKKRYSQNSIQNLLALKFLLIDQKDIGVMKVINFDKADDPQQAKGRFVKEVETLRTVQHPSILRLRDFNLEKAWFITDYYQKGTLSRNIRFFTGNVHLSLIRVRELLLGVKRLHECDQLHRDIKTDNIFVDDNGRLVLGDFGLVFNIAQNADRITRTGENVGSRYWQPPWTEGGSKEPNKKWDVYGIGKVLWSLITGLEKITSYYHGSADKPKENIENFLSESEEIEVVNEILKSSVTKDESSCISSASELIKLIDEGLKKIHHGEKHEMR